MATARLDAKAITDWDSFHSVCAAELGFPDFYGRNMDAFNDCLNYIDEGDGMSRFHLKPGEILVIEVPGWADLNKRLPEIAQALIECVAFVNENNVEDGKPPLIALILC